MGIIGAILKRTPEEIHPGDAIYVEHSTPAPIVSAGTLFPMSKPMVTTSRHYGIYVGDGNVIHFFGRKDSEARVIKTSCEEFSKTTFLDTLTGGVRTICLDYRMPPVFPPEEIIARAESKLQSDFGGYSFLRNNSEHFASWCATGKKTSAQIAFLNDDKDIVEKAIVRFFEPILRVSKRIDDYFGW